MLRLLLLAVVLAVIAPLAGANDTAERSVVKITTFHQVPHFGEPWRFDHVNRSNGTGFVVAGNRIITNAHVVSWAKEIHVRRFLDTRNYRARVRFIGHDSDLAILEVDDPTFFDGVAPLEFGELPAVRSTVVTYGFPAGGDEISYTRGVVSRIEVQVYAHNRIRSFLTVQTDAAINPGNSGGPVLQDGRVVGVAFQATAGLENAGFFIPPPVVRHFLDDVADGHYDGFPDSGIMLAGLENPAYRAYLGLPATLDRGIGARVDGILPVASTRARVEVDDVVVEVDGYPVGSDATVEFQGNRVHVGAIFDHAQAGETVSLGILRRGERIAVEVPMEVYRDDHAEGRQYDRLPRYFVHGGLVFTPLSLDYLATLGNDFGSGNWPDLAYELRLRPYADDEARRAEPVVLSQVLPHPVNADMEVRPRLLVDRINGVRIESLDDVVRAFDAGDGPDHVIEFSNEARFAVMDRAAARGASAGILESYGVPADRRL